MGLIRVVALCLLLSACTAQPTPFQLGAEVSPPPGCVDLRARGGKC